MKKLFKDDHYYKWLGEHGHIYLRYDSYSDFVSSGQVFLGQHLNDAKNQDELSWGRSLNWAELPNKDGISPLDINSKVSKLTLEQCFQILPNPKENSSGDYPIIERMYIENGGKWTVSIHDWYSSKDQIEYFSIENPDLLVAMHNAIVMGICRGIISVSKLKDI